MGARAVYLLVRQVLGAAVSQVEQARVDQTAVVPGSYGPPPCSDIAAFVHFGAAAVFFRRGKSGGGFPTYTALLFGGSATTPRADNFFPVSVVASAVPCAHATIPRQ